MHNAIPKVSNYTIRTIRTIPHELIVFHRTYQRKYRKSERAIAYLCYSFCTMRCFVSRKGKHDIPKSLLPSQQACNGPLEGTSWKMHWST